MATSTTKVLCRYFVNGSCSKGPSCAFSHDSKDLPDTVACRPKKTCSSLGPLLQPSQSGRGALGDSSNTTHLPKLDDVTLKNETSKLRVQAPEFVPGRVFHGAVEEATAMRDVTSHPQSPMCSGVAGAGLEVGSLGTDVNATPATGLLCCLCSYVPPPLPVFVMCPSIEVGAVSLGECCEYTNGDLCELCGKKCLNPFDPEQRKAHHRECVQSHEQEMEHAFAVQKSKEKTCGVCMEVVHSKRSLSDRRFGILSHCDHCFCLSCIRKWRSSTHTRKKTVRACPLCRTISHFVIPSQVWVDGKEEKQKLISQYKSNTSLQHCKHFKRGAGTCPFGNSCFYRHEYLDGTKAILPPKPRPRPRVAVDDFESHSLWDFLEDSDSDSDYEDLFDYDDFVHGLNWWSSSSESDDDFFL